jgi:hypothetical protein
MSDEDSDAYLENGAVAVLRKPYRRNVLLELLGKYT